MAVSQRMDAWLKTHVASVGSVAWAVYAAAGDTHRLANTPRTTLRGQARAARLRLPVLGQSASPHKSRPELRIAMRTARRLRHVSESSPRGRRDLLLLLRDCVREAQCGDLVARVIVCVRELR
jgi:hypothetical protein